MIPFLNCLAPSEFHIPVSDTYISHVEKGQRIPAKALYWTVWENIQCFIDWIYGLTVLISLDTRLYSFLGPFLERPSPKLLAMYARPYHFLSC